MAADKNPITSQEQYNEVRARIEELIREATTKGMLDPEADNEYIREIGRLARLTAEYEDTSMNILPLRRKDPLDDVIDDYITRQMKEIERDIEEMEKMAQSLLAIQVNIEQGTDGNYSAYIADEGCEFGCIGEGKTVDDTKADFLKAVEEMKAVYAEEGKHFPDVEFFFNYEAKEDVSES